MPPTLDREVGPFVKGIKAVRIGWTAQNLPPASVYRISKRRVLV